MRYVVIGGAGFLGMHLVDALIQDKQEVSVLDVAKYKGETSQKVEYQHFDICNLASVEAFKFQEDDIVVHLAANQYHLKVPHGKEAARDYFFGTNYYGTKNLLEAMDKQGCTKMIFFSTDMTYGKPQYLPVTPSHPQVPFGFYGESKKAAEELCYTYRKKGFAITIFRPRMILGPGRLGILSKLFRLMKMNFPVPLIGNGENCYQMVSVFDCVQAVKKCVQHDIPNKEYNLGSDCPPTVYELLQDVISNVGSHSMLLRTNGNLVKCTLSFLETLGISPMYREQYEIADENYILDIQDTKKDLDWHPEYNDKDMLYQAYEFYKEQKK